MLFKPEHVDPILSGRMTQIRKLWGRPMVEVGSTYEAKTALFSKDYFAHIIITGLREERLGAITFDDAIREGYDDLESYKEAWKRINGYWESECVVYVVTFELKVGNTQINTATNINPRAHQSCQDKRVAIDCIH
jgi:hypothetical protein